MSLRMNLYGWSLQGFRDILGSKNSIALDASLRRLTDTMQDEPALSQAKAWTRTLIEHGFKLRQDREPPSQPADGGLFTVQMETEVHAFAVYCIARAISRDDHLDLASESSTWKHGAVGALYNEASSCGFTRSGRCPIEYFSWMSLLSNGSPLFGDDFRTVWSFYTVFLNHDLGNMIPVLQAAADFKRQLPEGYPEHLAKNISTELSEAPKMFALDLAKWFSQIQQSGQDAFIFWW